MKGRKIKKANGVEICLHMRGNHLVRTLVLVQSWMACGSHPRHHLVGRVCWHQFTCVFFDQTPFPYEGQHSAARELPFGLLKEFVLTNGHSIRNGFPSLNGISLEDMGLSPSYAQAVK